MFCIIDALNILSNIHSMKFEGLSKREIEALKKDAYERLLADGYTLEEIRKFENYLRSIAEPLLDKACDNYLSELRNPDVVE